MAVMASLPPNGVGAEHKLPSAPPADPAIDVEMNGMSQLDPHEEMPPATAPAPESTTVEEAAVAVNGTHDINKDAVNAIAATVADAVPDAAATSPPPPPPPSSTIDAILDAPTIVPETLPTTAVPPVVEAPESDMRDEPRPEPADAPPALPVVDEIEPEETIVSLPPPAPEATQSTDDGVNADSVANLKLESSLHSDPASGLLAADTQDARMMDLPLSPAKVARDREDDDMDDGPAAKRAKTESMELDVVDQLLPTMTVETDQQIAPNQIKELLKATRGQKQSRAGMHFKAPVATLYPMLAESYLAKVTTPIDLTIIEGKLKDGMYPSLGDFTADLDQMVQNCVIFNGAEHEISKAAMSVRDTLLSKIPDPVFAEPKADKKAKRSTPAAESRATPVRRQSRVAAAPTPAPPAAPPQTFALGPSGTPVIRRDSTKGDSGRPKREIHPPKSKDLIYTTKPRKKKFATELKFCEDVLMDLKRPRHQAFTFPFLQPVDPVSLNIPEYFNIIKQPMDLSTIEDKLQTGQYESAKDFESDIRLMLNNCFKFNPKENHIHQTGRQLEEYFNELWSKKAAWVQNNQPASAATSPDSAADQFSDEDSFDEEEEEFDDAPMMQSALAQRLIEEQQKLIEIMASKKSDPAMIKMQQDFVAVAKKQVELERQQAAAARKAKKPKGGKVKTGGKKKADTKKKQEKKPRFMGTTEKEIISAGIQQLDAGRMETAFNLIQIDMPELDMASGEVELDIDAVSQPTLVKLYDLVIKHNPSLAPAKPDRADAAGRRPAAARPKKNKPMGKAEQELKIEKLKKLQQQFQKRSNGQPGADAGHVVPSVEQDQSSDDEEPSDSEED